MVGISFLGLLPLLLLLVWFPFTFWFMIRTMSMMQRMANELETLSRTLQSRE